MSDSTRRTFLVATGAGAAALSVSALAPAAQAATTTKNAKGGSPASDEPLVAYVSNASKGELTLLVGEREVLVHDRELVARLARAAS
ncbi:MAG TPA: hypothetical protein VHX15_16005 [Frankiaceae bacterium]|nr:hypothetical protein [Frankiaceae bacterium]